MIAPMVASLIASTISSLIQPVTSSLINVITGKGQGGGFLSLLALPLIHKIAGKGVKVVGRE